MFSKKTVIGMGVGSIAVILGVFFLIQSLTTNVHNVDDTIDIGKSDIFAFDALKHYHEIINVTGSSFHVVLKTPGDGLNIDKDFQREISFDWYSLIDGKHFINVTNTGGSILHVTGNLQAVTNPLIFTSHFIVISSGILIIGISAVFSIRKPKGF